MRELPKRTQTETGRKKMERYGHDYYHGLKSNYPKAGYESLDFDEMWKGLLNWLSNNCSHNKRLVDVGCGYGFMVAKAEAMGYDAYGIDISEYAINEGKKHNPKIATRLMTARGEQLSKIFMKDSVDIVTALEVLEHLQHPEIVLREIHKILKQKGLLCITTPTPNAPVYDATHINVLTPRQWLTLLKSECYEARRFSFSLSHRKVIRLARERSIWLDDRYRMFLALHNEKKYGVCNLLAQKI